MSRSSALCSLGRVLIQMGPVLILLAMASFATARSVTLVLESAQDPSAGFVFRSHETIGQRLLLWDEGAVAAPDSLAWQEHGTADLAIELSRSTLQMTAAAGRLALDAGQFAIDTPLVIEDGTITALLASGRLNVDGERIVYRRPAETRVPRGGTLFMLAGLALATAILLRAVRKRTRPR